MHHIRITVGKLLMRIWKVTDAVRMSMHIFDALGIPRDLFLEASRELVTLSNFNFIAVSESK